MKIKASEENSVAKSNQLPNMKIINISYGKFPAISYLHRNFQNGMKRLRVTLEVNGDFEKNGNFSSVFNKLLTILPTLAQHKCCENWAGPQPAPKLSSGISIKKVGDNTDFAHLVEHVMIDLMCNVGKMHLCSGITCGYESPRNRFDLFVECPQKRIGIYSANLAVFLVDQLLSSGELPRNIKETIELSRILYNHPRQRLTPDRISTEQGWENSLVEDLWDRLKLLQFFNHSRPN